MTLNGYFTLNCVSVPVYIELFCVTFENNCRKQVYMDPYYQRQTWLVDSSSYQCKVYADIRRVSGKKASNDSDVM